MRTRRLIIASVAAVAATVGLATPALAIDEVACWKFGAWLRLNWDGGAKTNCYANAGAKAMNLPNAYRWDAGNNSGWLNYAQSDGVSKWINFQHHQTGTLPTGSRFLYVDIR